MTDDSAVTLSRGLPETVLPAAPEEWQEALGTAATGAQPKSAVAAVAAAHPRFLEAWATLAELSEDDVESYAYARVGYHRGLDALARRGLARLGLRALEPRDQPRLPPLARGSAPGRRSDRRDRRGGALCFVPLSARSEPAALIGPAQPASSRPCR